MFNGGKENKFSPLNKTSIKSFPTFDLRLWKMTF